MLQWADVWIESSKPGMYDKWGYTDEHVLELNPKLVVVHVSGYGHFGDPDYVPRPSMDVIGQAFSGLMALNGEKEPSAPLVSKPASAIILQVSMRCGRRSWASTMPRRRARAM